MSCTINNILKDEKCRKKYINLYLIVYNTLQTIGWSYVLLLFINSYLNTSIQRTSYDEVKIPLTCFQVAAVLEIFHALFKFTRSNPVVTFQQVYSRVFLVLIVLLPMESSKVCIGFPMLLIAWSVTEIIRYTNYALALLYSAPHFIVWLRYSTFLVLYPLGVSGELICMYYAVDELKRTKRWSIDFPNQWNVMFYFYHVIVVTMVLYIPMFPQLFMHMIKQRRKVLGPVKVNTH